jgi:uncharacterized protein
MRARIVAALMLASCASGVLGCVSLKRTPEARFFVLRSLVEPQAVASTATPEAFVGVLPARLPGYLDRPQLVTELAGGGVSVDEYARWAEPFPEAVTRTLAENLAALLPEDRVVPYPWAPGAKARCRVSVELSAFAARDDGSARLEGRYALLPEDEEDPLVQRPVRLKRGPLPVSPTGVEPAATAEAMSELLAELSREIAASVRALPPKPAKQGPPAAASRRDGRGGAVSG